MPRPSAHPVPLDAAVPRSRTLETRVRTELLDIAAQSGLFAGWATIIAVAFAGLLLQAAPGTATLTAWLVLMIAVSVVRVAASGFWRQARRSDRTPTGDAGNLRLAASDLDRWETIHAVVAFACGLAWASLVYFADPRADHATLLVAFVFTIALVLAGSFQAINRVAHLLFGLPIVVAQVVNLQRFDVEYHGILGIAWLGVVVAIYFIPRIASFSLREGLVTRIESERGSAEQVAILETAPLGILVVRDSRIVVCNSAVLKILGYARKEDLLGHDMRTVVPDDDAWEQVQADARMAAQGRVLPRVVRRRRADGTTVDVMRNIAAVRSSGDGIEFVVIYEDVQERVAIEEGYRHAVRMQALVFESAGEGIAIVNDGIIEQANQALSDLVGIPVSQLGDRPLQSIFEDPHGWAEIEKRFQRLGNTLKLERRVLRSDGRAIWANVTGCLVDSAPQSSDGRGLAVTVGKRSIWILADLSVQKKKEAENWHHANHDVMTGLPNRRFLQDRLDQALAFARRDGRRVAVVELDLDGFKSVNDTYGHRFGDAVLEEVARRLSMVVRELDTVGRWGGDEFVLVLKEIESREVVEETVKRVIARLSEPIVYLGQNLSIGASIGIALFPDHGEEVEVLMLAADLAMYESKGSGGNTWRFSSPAAVAPRGKYRPAAKSQPAINS